MLLVLVVCVDDASIVLDVSAGIDTATEVREWLDAFSLNICIARLW